MQIVPSTTWATGTNLGPLTTIFTQPPDCAEAILFSAHSSIVNASSTLSNGNIEGIWLLYFTASFAHGRGCSNSRLYDMTTCWPSATVAVRQDDLEGWGFYSPGLICPKGYTTACGTVYGIDGKFNNLTSFSFQFQPLAGETLVGCCLPGYSCYLGPTGQKCRSISTTTFYSFNVQNCGANTKISLPATIQSAETQPMDLIRDAPLFQLNWRQEDLSPTGAIIVSSLVSTFTSSSPPRSDVHGATSHGLGSQATIAISVVVPVVSLAAFIAAVTWFLRHRRPRIRRQQQALTNDGYQGDGRDAGAAKELPTAGTQITEMLHPPQEMPSGRQHSGNTAELSGAAEVRAELAG